MSCSNLKSNVISNTSVNSNANGSSNTSANSNSNSSDNTNANSDVNSNANTSANSSVIFNDNTSSNSNVKSSTIIKSKLNSKISSSSTIIKSKINGKINGSSSSSNIKSKISGSRNGTDIKSKISENRKSVKIDWPNQIIFTDSERQLYRQEMFEQYDIKRSIIDPSIPTSEQAWRKYFAIKNLDVSKDISNETYVDLLDDEDLNGLSLVMFAGHEARKMLLIELLKGFCKWRSISLTRVKYLLYQGWLNLDYGWTGEKPSAKYTCTELRLCSDSDVFLQAFVRTISQYNQAHFNRYFQFVDMCLYEYDSYKEEYKVRYLEYPPPKDNLYYCLETELTCEAGILNYSNNHWRISTNFQNLYDTYISQLRIDFPLGVHTQNVTKDLMSIFCSPRCQKAGYYNLDTQEIVSHPEKYKYLHKGYRMFSENKDYCLRVAKFYKKHNFASNLFSKTVHPISRQYQTVLFIYARGGRDDRKDEK